MTTEEILTKVREAERLLREVHELGSVAITEPDNDPFQHGIRVYGMTRHLDDALRYTSMLAANLVMNGRRA